MGPWLVAAAVSGEDIGLVELEETVGRPGDSHFHHAACGAANRKMRGAPRRKPRCTVDSDVGGGAVVRPRMHGHAHLTDRERWTLGRGVSRTGGTRACGNVP